MELSYWLLLTYRFHIIVHFTPKSACPRVPGAYSPGYIFVPRAACPMYIFGPRADSPAGTTQYFRAGSPGSIFELRASSPRYTFGPRAVFPGYNTVLQGRQPDIQHNTSGQAALGTFMYQGLSALCTFLDQGHSALSTTRYFRAVGPRYIGGTRGGV